VCPEPARPARTRVWCAQEGAARPCGRTVRGSFARRVRPAARAEDVQKFAADLPPRVGDDGHQGEVVVAVPPADLRSRRSAGRPPGWRRRTGIEPAWPGSRATPVLKTGIDAPPLQDRRMAGQQLCRRFAACRDATAPWQPRHAPTRCPWLRRKRSIDAGARPGRLQRVIHARTSRPIMSRRPHKKRLDSTTSPPWTPTPRRPAGRPGLPSTSRRMADRPTARTHPHGDCECAAAGAGAIVARESRS
jgi:hypothetical protein